MVIKSVGVHQKDGSVCTTFRKLQRETEGLFPDFMGTLTAAKRYHIVNYEGTNLIEGRDDGVLITLHRDVR
jgi:hypothetical protein